MVRMAACDTSTTRSGVAIYENGKLKSWKLFDYSKIKDLEERTGKMCTALLSFLGDQKPELLYIEMPRGKKNVEVVRKLTMVIGAVYGWCLLNNCYFEQIPPSSWRMYLPDFSQGGLEREDLKSEGIALVKKKYGIEVPSDDVSDAILIGEAMIWKYKGAEETKRKRTDDSELFE